MTPRFLGFRGVIGMIVSSCYELRAGPRVGEPAADRDLADRAGSATRRSSSPRPSWPSRSTSRMSSSARSGSLITSVPSSARPPTRASAASSCASTTTSRSRPGWTTRGTSDDRRQPARQRRRRRRRSFGAAVGPAGGRRSRRQRGGRAGARRRRQPPRAGTQRPAAHAFDRGRTTKKPKKMDRPMGRGVGLALGGIGRPPPRRDDLGRERGGRGVHRAPAPARRLHQTPVVSPSRTRTTRIAVDIPIPARSP